MSLYEVGFHQLGKQEYTGVAFDDVLQRMYTATGTTCPLELANWLNVRQSWISDARREGKIPIAWLRQIFLKTDFNPYWVMTGEGSPEV